MGAKIVIFVRVPKKWPDLLIFFIVFLFNNILSVTLSHKSERIECMKRMLTYIILCMALLAMALPSTAKEYKVEDVPMVHLQDRTRYVSNPDGILSVSAVAEMDRILYQLEQKTGIETVVVAVEEIEGGDCFEFAYQLGKQHGVGKKGADNGLVILLVRGERCVQFATGYGIEGDLPDAICKRIQERTMFPLLREGKWDEGMVEGIRAVNTYLTDYEGWKASEADEEGKELLIVFGGFVVLVLFFIMICYFVVREQTKCPKCKKYALQRSQTRLLSKKNGIKTNEVVYTCKHCGHTVVKREQEEDDSYTGYGGGGGSLGGPFVFGHGRGGTFHGGGFGGSFGGGSFGGGGAGGRF